MKIYFYLALCIFSIFDIKAQKVEFQKSFYNINSDNGLQSSEVYKVGQDSKGIMWFCTDAGVTQYDGFNFKTYTVEDGMTDNVVFDFFEDHKGRIWFLTYNSMLCYLENEKIITYKYNDVISKEVGKSISTTKTFYIDKNDNIYYSLKYAGLFTISSTGILKTLHKKENSFELIKVDHIYMWSHHFFNSLSNRFPAYSFEIDQSETNPSLNPRDTVIRIWNDSKLKGLGPKGCFLYANKLIDTENFEIIYKETGLIRMGKLNSKDYWISTMNGLLIGKVDEKKKFITAKRIFPGHEISDVFKDREGMYWVSTLNNGVFYAGDLTVENCNETNGLMKSNVVDVAEFNSELFTSYQNGWQELSNNTVHYTPNIYGYTKLATTSKYLVIAESSIPAPKIIKNKLFIPSMNDIYIADNNEIYSVSHSVFKYNYQKNSLDLLYVSVISKEEENQTSFTAIAVIKNEIVLGNLNGVYRIRKSKTLEKINFPDCDIKSVTDILYDEFWGLIVSTSNTGVYVFKNDKLTHHLTEQNGLISNNVSCLEIDKEKRLYIGTSAGVNVKTFGKKNMYLISRNQGLVRPEINSLNLLNDFMYIGTRYGVYKVNYQILFNQDRAQFVRPSLKSIFIDAKRAIVRSNKLTVPYNTNNLKINFEVLNFKNWHNKRYRYQLSPDEPWIETNYPEIVLLQVQGDLNIHVSYLNDINVWSQPYALISLEVKVPLWKRWYFYLLVGALSTLILIALIRKRQKSRERILIMKNDMLALEQRTQNARMNPHCVFNVLNSIHSCLIFNENELAEKYLLKFSGLMRDIMKTSGESSISISTEIEILTKYLDLESLRHNQSFDFQISVQGLSNSILIPSMLVQPFVENSIIHGVSRNTSQKGTINIQYKKLSSTLIEILIEDNGEVFESEIQNILNEDDSHAIGITLQRLKNYNKLFQTVEYHVKFDRYDQNDPLTVVKLYVPILKQ